MSFRHSSSPRVFLIPRLGVLMPTLPRGCLITLHPASKKKVRYRDPSDSPSRKPPHTSGRDLNLTTLSNCSRRSTPSTNAGLEGGPERFHRRNRSAENAAGAGGGTSATSFTTGGCGLSSTINITSIVLIHTIVLLPTAPGTAANTEAFAVAPSPHCPPLQLKYPYHPRRRDPCI